MLTRAETLARAVSLLLEEVLILGSKVDDLEMENFLLRKELEKIKKDFEYSMVGIFNKHVETNGPLYTAIKNIINRGNTPSKYIY